MRLSPQGLRRSLPAPPEALKAAEACVATPSIHSPSTQVGRALSALHSLLPGCMQMRCRPSAKALAGHGKGWSPATQPRPWTQSLQCSPSPEAVGTSPVVTGLAGLQVDPRPVNTSGAEAPCSRGRPTSTHTSWDTACILCLVVRELLYHLLTESGPANAPPFKG